MLPQIALIRSLLPYFLLASLVAFAYVKGRADGAAVEQAAFRSAREASAKARIEAATRYGQALAEYQKKLSEQQKDAADAVERVRVEYLPSKTVVKREVVEKPVYRECRIDGRMFDLLNRALRGPSGH